jgi:hypothetical protein
MKTKLDPEFRQLIFDYFSAINKAYNLMIEEIDMPVPKSPLDWRLAYPKLKGEFTLNGKNEFFIHGFGCDFLNSEINVKWDFGRHGEINGIEHWKLYDFMVNAGKKVTGIESDADIKKELLKAVNENEMFIQDDLYFFKVHRPRKRGIIKANTKK